MPTRPAACRRTRDACLRSSQACLLGPELGGLTTTAQQVKDVGEADRGARPQHCSSAGCGRRPGSLALLLVAILSTIWFFAVSRFLRADA
jgi:hypothetical protein